MSPSKPLQRSRAMQPVSDETLANYTAARAFMTGMWTGAILMVLSFTQLYIFLVFDLGVTGKTSVVGGFALLVLGSFMFWKSRTYYQRLDWPWKRRWANAAVVVAGSGLVFWFIFAIIMLLAWRGINILPGG